MYKKRQAQAGFTLVEIVVVIVLLGILAAVAVPRFVNLQSDARESVLQGVKASIQGAGVQIFAKALIQNEAGATGTVTTNLPSPADSVAVVNGYPDSTEVEGLINIDDVDIKFDSPVVLTDTDVAVGYDSDGDGDASDDGCYLTYTEAAAGDLPTVVATDVTGC